MNHRFNCSITFITISKRNKTQNKKQIILFETFSTLTTEIYSQTQKEMLLIHSSLLFLQYYYYLNSNSGHVINTSFFFKNFICISVSLHCFFPLLPLKELITLVLNLLCLLLKKISPADAERSKENSVNKAKETISEKIEIKISKQSCLHLFSRNLKVKTR